MKVQEFHRSCLSSLGGSSAKGTREEQLIALVEYAQRRLLSSMRTGPPAYVQASTHLLISAHTLLSRWINRRNRDDEPAEDDGTVRISRIEYQATMGLLQSDRDILKKWENLVDQIKASVN